MKNTITAITTSLLLCLSANATVTFSFKTHPGASGGSDGLPVVDASGFPILNSTNSVFASLGYLTAGGDSTAQSVLNRFVALDSTALTPSLTQSVSSVSYARNGLISGADYTNAGTVLPTNYVANFQGKTAVVLIGNNSNLSLSTEIAAFSFNLAYGTPDGLGNIAQTFNLTSASSLTAATAVNGYANAALVGTIVNISGQPVTAAGANNTFTKGIQLASLAPIPETSTSLLGAIGALALLRRRRN
jgi:hypothetical protein